MAQFGLCLVSGASGFLGRRFVNYLEDFCDEIIVIGRNPVRGYNFVYWDLNEELKPNLVGYDIDTVFHLAGYAHDTSMSEKSSMYERCNAIATKNLLEASAGSGAKHFLFVSSAKAGGEGYEVPLDEYQQDLPHGVYGMSKLLGEQHLKSAGYKDIAISILRPTLMYGPNLKGNLAKMRNAILQGWFPRPPRDIPGLKSMVHVDDCVRALVHLRTYIGKGVETFYLTDGCEYSAYDIDFALRSGSTHFRIQFPKWFVDLGLKIPFLKRKLAKMYGFNLYSSQKIKSTGFSCVGSILDLDRELF